MDYAGFLNYSDRLNRVIAGVNTVFYENRDCQRYWYGARGIAPGGFSSSEHEVAWTAYDGAEAIALSRVDRPI